MTKAISIIIPTYKEKENIVPLVERIHNSLSKYDYEIVIVDDNSADGSEELVAEFISKVSGKNNRAEEQKRTVLSRGGWHYQHR